MASETPVRLTVSLSGVDSALLHETFNQLSRASSRRPSRCTRAQPNYPQRYASCAFDQLRLGFVSADPLMGAWGRTSAVLFTPTSNKDAFTAVVPILPSAAARVGASGLLPIRLVIVDEPLLLAAASGVVTHGAAIVAVENLQSNPDTVPLLQDTFGDWSAKWNVAGRALRFSPAAEQFPFLSQFTPVNVAPDVPKAGPLLSLTLYANDPRVRYEREVWLASLPPHSRDAVMFMQREASATGTEPLAITTTMEVEDIYPVRSDGCRWREEHLPTPSPMERQMHAVRMHNAEKKRKTKKKNDNNDNTDKSDNMDKKNEMHPNMEKPEHCSVMSTTSVASDTSASSVATAHRGAIASGRKNASGSHSIESVENALQRRGWCVQPLHHVDPVPLFSPGEEQLTMRVWHLMVNVSPLEGRGLQIEAAMPIPIYGMSHQEGSEDSFHTTPTSSVTSNGFKSGKTFLCQTNKNTNSNDSSANYNEDSPCNCNSDTWRKKEEVKKNVLDNSSNTVIGVRWIRGVAMLQPPMFKQHTSSTLTIPMCFTDAFASDELTGNIPVTYWQTVYVQYLFVFPFEDHRKGGNSLEVIRSLASLNRLSTNKLVGHRGLGKTYTRGVDEEEDHGEEGDKKATAADNVKDTSEFPSAKTSSKRRARQIVKLAENSLESLNAAHRRGCEMVEFDVMLTRDRVPVIFHDPLIQLQAREKKWVNPMLSTSGASFDKMGRSPSFLDLGVSPCNLQAAHSIRSHSLCGMGSHLGCRAPSIQAYQMYMQGFSNYASIPVAMHQLTKRQLDLITTETFTYGKSQNTLRNLILRHWHQILRVSRNRRRRMYIESLHIKPRESDGEFSGCLPDDGGSRCQVHAGGNACDAVCSAKANDGSDDFYKKFLRNPQGIRAKEEDVTNHICTLRDLFEETPPSLRFDLEVKFPFQPILDSNLFLQTDAFEINGFVDAILNDVFEFADQRQHVQNPDGSYTDYPRDVIFSSFEPDICIALKAKQSRFDVVFLCDTTATDDIKDYRSFGLVEGTLQFSILLNLSGISIYSISLCNKDQVHFVSTQNLLRLPKRLPGGKPLAQSERNDPFTMAARQREENWAVFDPTRGANIVKYAHAHGQRVWTWGANNNDEQFTYVQSRYMKVDAIITDTVPLWSRANVEAEEFIPSPKALST